MPLVTFVMLHILTIGWIMKTIITTRNGIWWSLIWSGLYYNRLSQEEMWMPDKRNPLDWSWQLFGLKINLSKMFLVIKKWCFCMVVLPADLCVTGSTGGLRSNSRRAGTTLPWVRFCQQSDHLVWQVYRPPKRVWTIFLLIALISLFFYYEFIL